MKQLHKVYFSEVEEGEFFFLWDTEVNEEFQPRPRYLKVPEFSIKSEVWNAFLYYRPDPSSMRTAKGFWEERKIKNGIVCGVWRDPDHFALTDTIKNLVAPSGFYGDAQ